ncbi:ureidoglycolate hydrolase protein [Rutstroemia sp. NJR-2017a WRK4]|nr:ureidoglycolate hydrolase protein [Rutstroemia sp. NJR-2017a WRK4]
MPPTTLPGSVDSKNKFEDLSGVDTAAYENPYDALIEACNNDPAGIQNRYATHREARNEQQKAKILASDFPGLIIDPVLQKLEDPTIEPGYIDPRNCLVFWARPPAHIKSLVGKIQQKLQDFAPNLWLMPIPNLHLTALEITHSLTSPEITTIVSHLGPEAITTMTDHTYTHRARLIKPTLSYDSAALALSFLPAAGESLTSAANPSAKNPRTVQDDAFTYHHLRKELFAIARSTGVSVDSRYVVPSSHITVGRFLTQADHDTPEKRQKWIELIEEINGWLREEYWPKEGGERNEEGEWVVGQEKGLDCREGTLWYGGGKTIRLGKGF